MQVNFNTETTVIAQITIYDENENEVNDLELFSNIINDIGFDMDYETTYEHEYNGKKYNVVVESVTEEKMYIDFEVY